MKLYKNGHDLFDSLCTYLKVSGNYSVFVPYVKSDKLLKLLSENSQCKQLVVRWLPIDLIIGVSDIEVFDICQDRGITFYRNPKLHLKAFTDMSSCFMGSANISERAMSEVDNGNINYELATIVDHIDLDTKLYFQKILIESVLVTSNYVSSIQDQIENFKTQSPDHLNKAEFNDSEKQDDFLLSALPMTSSVKILLDVYFGNGKYDNEELNCVAHDLALYRVPRGLERGPLIQHLENEFNRHPFIKALKQYIEEQTNAAINYGGVVRWVQDNTTTVPTPRSWDLKEKQIVNALYDWICEFDDTFHWDRPNHSQILRKL